MAWFPKFNVCTRYDLGRQHLVVTTLSPSPPQHSSYPTEQKPTANSLSALSFTYCGQPTRRTASHWTWLDRRTREIGGGCNSILWNTAPHCGRVQYTAILGIRHDELRCICHISSDKCHWMIAKECGSMRNVTPDCRYASRISPLRRHPSARNQKTPRMFRKEQVCFTGGRCQVA